MLTVKYLSQLQLCCLHTQYQYLFFLLLQILSFFFILPRSHRIYHKTIQLNNFFFLFILPTTSSHLIYSHTRRKTFFFSYVYQHSSPKQFSGIIVMILLLAQYPPKADRTCLLPRIGILSSKFYDKSYTLGNMHI